MNQLSFWADPSGIGLNQLLALPVILTAIFTPVSWGCVPSTDIHIGRNKTIFPSVIVMMYLICDPYRDVHYHVLGLRLATGLSIERNKT